MKHPQVNDYFNAMLIDLVADQVRRALELGWTPAEVENGVLIAMGHGLNEYRQGLRIEKEIKKGAN